MMYMAMKHIHLTAIALSVLLFVTRYIMVMANSSIINKKFFKITPHVIDTIMLASGVALIFITGFIPFTAGNGWLTEKLTCVLAYIALGYFTLHHGKNKVFKTFAFLGAIGWLVLAAQLAITKTPILG